MEGAKTEIPDNNGNPEPFRRGYATKEWLLPALIILGLAISWTGIVDKAAERAIDHSLLDAGVIYGSARVINGLVSVLQEVELSTVLLTVSPMEFLDPVNDLVERFSEVMTFALASLAMQKVLLLVMKNQFFAILVTIASAFTILSVFLKLDSNRFWLRALLSLFIIRVSIGLIILVNATADMMFLKEATNQSKKDISALEASLTSVSDLAALSGQPAKQDDMAEIESGISEASNERRLELQAIDVAQKEIEERESQIDVLRDESPFLDRWNPMAEEDRRIAEHREAIKALIGEVKSRSARIEVLTEKINELEEKKRCENKRAKGESCSISEWAKRGFSVATMKSRVQSAVDSVSTSVDSIVDMIALIVLKSIVLPLTFWWVLFRVVKSIWYEESVIVGWFALSPN